MIVSSKLNRLVMLSKAWSIDEALWILWVYRCEHDEICWRSFWTTPYEIGIVEDGDCHALQVKVKFLGGPNGNQEYTGSLSMFVVDRVLWRWRGKKLSWSWLLRFDTSKAVHIKDQLGKIKPNFQQKLLPGFEDERNEPPFDYVETERVVDYVQIGDDIYPILESGRQGCAVQQTGKPICVTGLSAKMTLV